MLRLFGRKKNGDGPPETDSIIENAPDTTSLPVESDVFASAEGETPAPDTSQDEPGFSVPPAEFETQEQNSSNRNHKGKGRRVLIVIVGAVLVCAGISQFAPNGTQQTSKSKEAGTAPSEALKLTEAESANQPYAILDTSGGTYYGPVEALQYVGKGEFTFSSKGVYEGEFKDSKRSGTGTFTWPNGDKYSGTWSQDNMVSGTYSFKDGRTYVGTFKKNTFLDGTYTVPESYHNSNIKSLEVAVAKGSPTTVRLSLTNGFTFSGLINGAAEITYPSGSTYSGTVKDGKRSGTGEYKWIENGTVQAYYQGEWINDAMSGEGTYHYSSSEYPSLQGAFLNGRPTGTLVYSKEAGNTFNTVWQDGTCKSVTET